MLIAGAAGVAALLLTYPFIAALIKWAGIAYLLFIAWQLARPHVSGKDLSRPGMKPLSFWQSAAFQYANPKAWMFAAATAGSFMASNASIARIAIVVARVFDRCHRKSYHLDLGGRRAAKLAQRRLANAILQRCHGRASRRYRIVAGDAVKCVFNGYQHLGRLSSSLVV